MKLIATGLLSWMTFTAFAEEAAVDAATTAQAAPSPAGQAMVFGAFILIFYFLILRPQNKRAKAHRNLMASLSVGDEVVTVGGLVGKIEKVVDDFIVLNLNDNLNVKIQKSAVTSALPKGTLKAI